VTNWIEFSKEMRISRRFDIAQLALRNAEAVLLESKQSPHLISTAYANKSTKETQSEFSNMILLNEALILRDRGDLSSALRLIEPIEINAKKLKTDLKRVLGQQQQQQLHDGNGHKGIAMEQQAFENDLHAKHQYGERLHLATQLMIALQAKQGAVIMDRFESLSYLYHLNNNSNNLNHLPNREVIDDYDAGHNDLEVIYFEWARHLESLYFDIKTRFDNLISSRNALSSSQKSEASVTKSTSNSSLRSVGLKVMDSFNI
jgi:hypothetical protein